MLRTELRSSQNEAVERALAHDGFAIFCEQRTGKTLIALKIVTVRQPDRLLVISNKKGIAEFNRQLQHHVDTGGFGWDGEKVLLINYERLWRNRKEIRDWIESGENSMVILDESHRIKRRGSKFYKAARFICWRYPKYGPPVPTATHRLLMTGTPIAQGQWDAWAQFNVMNPSIFGTWDKFRRRHCRMHGLWKSKVVGFRNLARFNRLFHKYSHRVTLREVRAQEGKPGLKIRTVKLYADFTPQARKAYNEIEKDLITMIDLWDEQKRERRRRRKDGKIKVNFSRAVVTAPLVITQVMKMQQITGGFVIDDSKIVRPVGDMKLKLVRQLLTGEIRKRKCVIVARFLHEIRAIRRLAQSLGKSVETIQGGVEFSGKQTADVAIVQIASGVAIDLSASQHIIFYSWDYSYINWEQTRFRVLSFDTDRVNYFLLFVRESNDEQIYKVVTGKQNVAKAVCDHYRLRSNRERASRGSR